MKKVLKQRQAIVDNYEKLIKRLPKNMNQASMFEDEPIKINLEVDEAIYPLAILEAERDVLGLVASVEYIKSDNIYMRALDIPRLSEANVTEKIAKASAICLGLEFKDFKGKSIPTVIFGDSIRKIEVEVPLEMQYRFNHGELYLIKYRQFNVDKEYATYKILNARLVNRNINNSLFRKGSLEMISNGSTNKERALEFVYFLKSIEDEHGVKVAFKYNGKRLRTKIQLDCEIYNLLTNYFKLELQWKKLKTPQKTT